jgi:hypothetical protein
MGEMTEEPLVGKMQQDSTSLDEELNVIGSYERKHTAGIAISWEFLNQS